MVRRQIAALVCAAPVALACLGCSLGDRLFERPRRPAASSQLSTERLMTIARTFEQQGRSQSAKELYAQVLKRDPAYAEAEQRMDVLLAAERPAAEGLQHPQTMPAPISRSAPASLAQNQRPVVPASAATQELPPAPAPAASLFAPTGGFQQAAQTQGPRFKVVSQPRTARDVATERLRRREVAVKYDWAAYPAWGSGETEKVAGRPIPDRKAETGLDDRPLGAASNAASIAAQNSPSQPPRAAEITTATAAAAPSPEALEAMMAEETSREQARQSAAPPPLPYTRWRQVAGISDAPRVPTAVAPPVAPRADSSGLWQASSEAPLLPQNTADHERPNVPRVLPAVSPHAEVTEADPVSRGELKSREADAPAAIVPAAAPPIVTALHRAAPEPAALSDLEVVPTHPTLESADQDIARSAAALVQTFRQDAGASVPDLVRLVEDRGRPAELRALSACLLGEAVESRQPSLAALRRVLRGESDPFVRLDAARSILKLEPGDAASVTVLADALRHGAPQVQWYAACCLSAAAEGSHAAAVEALTWSLRTSDAELRTMSALTLAEFGPAAGPAAPLLRQCLAERDERVRAAAGAALSCIELTSAVR